MLRYVHVKNLYLSKEVAGQMVESIGRPWKSSKKRKLEKSKIISVKLLTNWKIPDTIRSRSQISKTIDGRYKL